MKTKIKKPAVPKAVMTTAKIAAEAAAAVDALPRSKKKCKARDLGHPACDCGGPHCGDNATI